MFLKNILKKKAQSNVDYIHILLLVFFIELYYMVYTFDTELYCIFYKKIVSFKNNICCNSLSINIFLNSGLFSIIDTTITSGGFSSTLGLTNFFENFEKIIFEKIIIFSKHLLELYNYNLQKLYQSNGFFLLICLLFFIAIQSLVVFRYKINILI